MEFDNNPLITSAVEIPEYIIRHTTLRQFQIFEAIVRLGSFTRAAEELFLTQPTVSMQTKKLSDSIGLPLLEQVGRRVQPTEAGRELYTSVRTIFQTLSNVDGGLRSEGCSSWSVETRCCNNCKIYCPSFDGWL